MDYCHCAKPIVIEGARGLGERCAKCLMWYDKNHWQSDPRVGLAYKLEAESQSIADDIIRVGLQADRQREAKAALDRQALREKKRKQESDKSKFRRKVEKMIARLFGRN